MKFKILHGAHCHGKDDAGRPKLYRKGDIVESTVDLRKLNQFNALKFQLVDEALPTSQPSVPNVQTRDGLDDMTIEELRQLAEDEGTDLGNATRKQQIVTLIREARS